MNSTSTDYAGLSPVLIALRTCFIAIIALLIISGNILSIAVTRRVTNLADSTKVLMTSLAVSDLLVGFSTLLSLMSSALNKWPFGDVVCVLSVTYTVTTLTMSVISLVFLNIERFIAVTRPYKFPVWCSRRRVITLVLLTSLFSLLWAVLLKKVLQIPVKFFSGKQLCFYVHTSAVLSLMTLLTMLIIPTALMSTSYYHLIKISRQHEQRLNRNDHNDGNNNHGNKAFKTFLVVTMTFSVCYAPIITLSLVESTLGISAPNWLLFFTIWLAISNSMFNVIIYCLFNKNFRQTAKKILAERFPCFFRSIEPMNIAI